MTNDLIILSKSDMEDMLLDLQDWAAYAGDYFHKKYDMAGSLVKYRAILDKAQVVDKSSIKRMAIQMGLSLDTQSEQIKDYERKIAATIKWLEANHSEVFSEGIWEAIS